MEEMKMGRNATTVTPYTEPEVIHIATMKQMMYLLI
jgi:hypothetical protein